MRTKDLPQSCSCESRFLSAVIDLSISVTCYATKTPEQSTSLGRTVEVPLDYRNPNLAHAPLYFEFGAPYDRKKPVVFIITDAQLFIADDNHVFATLNEEGLVNRLVESFLEFGLTSHQFQSALNTAEPQRWTER